MHDSLLFNRVFRFNRDVVKVPERGDIGLITPDQLAWTEKAYLEELRELKQAYAAGDVVGQIDATLDLIYFAVGTLYKSGMTSEEAAEAFVAVHDANMAKKRGKKEGRGSEEDAVKPADWVGPETAILNIIMRRGRK